MDTIFIWWIRW